MFGKKKQVQHQVEASTPSDSTLNISFVPQSEGIHINEDAPSKLTIKTTGSVTCTATHFDINGKPISVPFHVAGDGVVTLDLEMYVCEGDMCNRKLETHTFSVKASGSAPANVPVAIPLSI